MKSYKEMASSALERIHDHDDKKAEKLNSARRMILPVSMICLVLLAGFGALQIGLSYRSQNDPGLTEGPDGKVRDAGESAAASDSTSQDQSSGYETEAPFAVTDDAGKTSEQSAVDTFAEDVDAPIDGYFEGFCQWNEKTITQNLMRAINAAGDDDVIAILARPAFDFGFEYEGKTLNQYYSEKCDEDNLADTLTMLLKDGDYLKYGEALYTTGTPDGERWAKELYDERVGFYGEEILGKYIIDGRFLIDDLEKDIEEAEEADAAEKAYEKAKAAFLEYLAASVAGDRPSEAVPDKNGIIIYLTKSGLKDFEESLGWWYDDANAPQTITFVEATAD